MTTELKLTAEQEELCKVVYRKSGKPGEPAVFDGLWHPDAEYSEEHLIVPITSAFDEVVSLKAGQEFVNVIWSKKDPLYYDSGTHAFVKSWRDALKNQNIDTSKCCAEPCWYSTGDSTKHDLSCCTEIIGGHVLIDVQCAQVGITDGTVYLLPICKTHNGMNNSGTKGFPSKEQCQKYMKLCKDINAIKLKNYMQ